MNDLSIAFAHLFLHPGQRASQEDQGLIDLEKKIFSIADGFGSQEKTAEFVLNSIKAFLWRGAGDREATLPFVLRHSFSLAANVLFNAVLYANAQLMKQNESLAFSERSGASLLCGFLEGDLLSLANVGGCRAYLFRSGKKGVLLNRPRLFSSFRDPLEAPMADEVEIPLMALGLFSDLEPEIYEYRLRPGDLLVLSTDGVTEPFVVEEVGPFFIKQQQAQGSSPSSPGNIPLLLEKQKGWDHRGLVVCGFKEKRAPSDTGEVMERKAEISHS